VVITIAEAPGSVIRRIVNECEKSQLPAKIVPGLYELLGDNISLSRIRAVSIEDLLGREAVKLDLDEVAQFLVNRTVLISGAGGSIGSELCRQVARFGARKVVLAERCEYALFTIQQELLATFPNTEIVARICDIGDRPRVEEVFGEFRPHVVFHAAAHKHVPMMEDNAGEAVKNNIFGTKTFADVAEANHVDTFVLISTDKAVNPTSVMGATKRVAEMYLQSVSRRASTRFVAVRFGNVLGSAGSVVPTFKSQIAAGGPVTVTHPEMRRYFMTIPEATQLVIQAAAMGTRGEIFVLDMGEPIKIVDLARELIRLSGFEPDQDVRISYTGLRPGEKLFEELGFNEERMTRTKHRKIFIGKLTPVTSSQIEEGLGELARVTDLADAKVVRAALRRLVPDMAEPYPDAGKAEVISTEILKSSGDNTEMCAS
jgi:FlaA1/EpsC-like NDP-sugar epimerase